MGRVSATTLVSAFVNELEKAGFYPGLKSGEVHIDGNFGGIPATATITGVHVIRSALLSRNIATSPPRHAPSKHLDRLDKGGA